MTAGPSGTRTSRSCTTGLKSDADICELSQARRKNVPVGFFGHVGAVAMKDLRVELRSREVVYTMLFFGAMVILIFSFAFVEGRTGKAVGDVSSGLLWISVLFSGTLGLSRAFDREREGNTMRGLLLSPVPRAAIFLGKATSIAVIIVITEVIVVPMIAVMFHAPMFRDFPALVVTLLLTTAGFSIVGSVFALMLLKSRARAVLLPVMLYPILVPLLIGAAKATTALIGMGGDPSVAWFWVRFIVVYDAIFLIASLWFFESMVIE